MSKQDTRHELIPVADDTYFIQVASEKSVSIGLSNKTTGTPTAGTWTFRGKVAGEKFFQPINGTNIIDFADYAGITIDVAVVAELEVTVLGVAGSGLTDDMFAAVNRFDYRV